ncbi:MAG TPA: hypothetical protein VLR26_16780, partial [Frankiaceae bacterium]|nr:hypothetical protein [Frankiaceae bacterium]
MPADGEVDLPWAGTDANSGPREPASRTVLAHRRSPSHRSRPPEITQPRFSPTGDHRATVDLPWARTDANSGPREPASRADPAHRRSPGEGLPAFNEAATLEPVLRNILEKKIDGLDKEVVIVESNSTD